MSSTTISHYVPRTRLTASGEPLLSAASPPPPFRSTTAFSSSPPHPLVHTPSHSQQAHTYARGQALPSIPSHAFHSYSNPILPRHHYSSQPPLAVPPSARTFVHSHSLRADSHPSYRNPPTRRHPQLSVGVGPSLSAASNSAAVLLSPTSLSTSASTSAGWSRSQVHKAH